MNENMIMNRSERDVLLALKAEAIFSDPINDEGFPEGEATVAYFAKIDELAALYRVKSIVIQREINRPIAGDVIRDGGMGWNSGKQNLFGRVI